MLLFRLSGVLLLRFAARRLIGLLFQDPPRRTRARPHITALAGRWCHAIAGDLALPAADQPPEFVGEAGGVLVLIDAQEPQLAGQPEVGPQCRQLEVGLGQTTIGLARRVEQGPLTPEGSVFHLSRQDEPLLLRKLRRGGQQPAQQVIRLREDRRVLAHPPEANTRLSKSA
jgi:hypothetical protein